MCLAARIHILWAQKAFDSIRNSTLARGRKICVRFANRCVTRRLRATLFSARGAAAVHQPEVRSQLQSVISRNADPYKHNEGVVVHNCS